MLRAGSARPDLAQPPGPEGGANMLILAVSQVTQCDESSCFWVGKQRDAFQGPVRWPREEDGPTHAALPQ